MEYINLILRWSLHLFGDGFIRSTMKVYLLSDFRQFSSTDGLSLPTATVKMHSLDHILYSEFIFFEKH